MEKMLGNELIKCCREAVNEVINIGDRLKKGQKADDTELFYRLDALKYLITEFSSEPEVVNRVSRTICDMMSIIIRNDDIAKFLYSRNFLYNFAMRTANLEMPAEYKIEMAGMLEDFMDNANVGAVNMDIIINMAVNAGYLCSEMECSRIKIEFYKNLYRLSSSSIYFSLINGIINMDSRIMSRFKVLCRNAVIDGIAENADLHNPVYAMLMLYQQHYFDSLEDFENLLSENQMFIMVRNPHIFNGEYFDPRWWKLLILDPDLTEKLCIRKSNPELFIEKLLAGRDRCFPVNMYLYDDIIQAFRDFSALREEENSPKN